MRNGCIPARWLKELPGRNAGLIKGYAYAYWAMHYHSLRIGGPSLAIFDGSVGRTYRSYARQVLAKRVYGSNAAWPGTSNHGWARAVDLMYQAQRAIIDRIGRAYGWAKAWSDASWEWWHLRGMKTMAAPHAPDPLRTLTRREKQKARRLLYHRREMHREAKSGHGPRWRKQLKWARFYKHWIEGRVEDIETAARKDGQNWSKRNRAARFKKLKAVLLATNGRL